MTYLRTFAFAVFCSTVLAEPSAEPAPFINTWLVAGPFENGAAGVGLDRDWIGEAQVQPTPGAEAAGRTWRYFDDRLFSRNYDDYQDLFSYLRIKRGESITAQVVYAHVYVHSHTEQHAQLRVGADGAFRSWLNGKAAASSITGTPARDAVKSEVLLQAGWNRLLIKVANRKAGRLGFYCRLSTLAGEKLPGLTFPAGGGSTPALAVFTQAMADAGTGPLPVAFRDWPYVAADATRVDNPDCPPLRKPEMAMRASEFVLNAGGGEPPYRWSLASGRLPAGLTLRPDGAIVGVVSSDAPLGEQAFKVRVIDARGATAEAALSVIVKERPNKWYEECRLTALMHCPEKMPADGYAEFARLMRRQGYGVGMMISYNNGDHAYRWPSPFEPENPLREVAGRYKAALEAEGIRFGMYIGNFDGDNHDGFDGALLVLEDACRRFKPASFWFDWAGWDGTSLDALFSVIRSVCPDTVIVLNGIPTMSNGDWDIINLEGWSAWGRRHWDLWPFPVNWPKRTAVESWRLVADPAFEYSKGVEPDWQEYLRLQISLIGEGYIADIDHSVTIRTPIKSLDDSPTIRCHRRMADWSDPPGGIPRYPSYTNVNPGPLAAASWGYNVISLDRRTIYLHLLANPYGRIGKPNTPSLKVGPLAAGVREVTWLNAGRKLEYKRSEDQLEIRIEGVTADPVDTIIRIELTEPEPSSIPTASSPAAVSRGNLAYHKPAQLLSADGKRPLPASAWHFARYGVDGHAGTFAQGGDEWAWVYHVDLREVYSIRRVVVRFAEGYATEFQLLTSQDGLKWAVEDRVSGFAGGVYDRKLPGSSARYVRVRAIKPDAPDQPGTQMSIAELEVYE